QSVVDPEVSDVVAKLKARRGGGPELLAYKGVRAGRPAWVDIASDDINTYIRDRSGLECSAKDFRTWNATVLAAVALAGAAGAKSGRGRARGITRAMEEVAQYLGNTPAVVRKSYVDPRVVDRYLSGETISSALGASDLGSCAPGAGTTAGQPAIQGTVELAVLDLLDPAAETERAA
ncbi:MAG: DNA topoisomerase IB, partial [Acidimicrobiales bacterium]